MKTSSLYVTRDDSMYDTKSGFETYEEANAYREEVREAGSIMPTMFSYNKRLCREFCQRDKLDKSNKGRENQAS